MLTPRINLRCKLVLVQYREYENSLLRRAVLNPYNNIILELQVNTVESVLGCYFSHF